MRTPCLIAAPLLIAFLAGCSSISPYLMDRARDLTDVAHIDLTYMSFGAGVNVGPAVLGLTMVSAPCGDGTRLKFGLGMPEGRRVQEGYAGVIWPILRTEAKSRSSSKYGKTFPPWGSAGCDAGLIFGMSARADVVELMDFILGIGGVDILKDDENFEIEQWPPEKRQSEQHQGVLQDCDVATKRRTR